MSDELYLWPTRWEDFQHYKPERDRPPAWLKDYTKQNADDVYRALTLAERGLLRDIRAEFALAHSKLRADPKQLSSRIGATVKQHHLERLNEAGFVEFLSRATLEQRLEQLYASRARPRAREEGEKERELEDPLTPTDVGESSSTNNNTRPCRQCGAPVDPGRPCRACGATPRQAGSNPRRPRTPTPYTRAEAFVRNAGWQYDDVAFADELDRFHLDPYETSLLEQLRDQLLARTRTSEPALDEEPLF